MFNCLPKVIVSRDGKEQGESTGGTRPCTLEGCAGTRIAVRWSDKKLTYPCSKGMREVEPGIWQII